MVADAKATAAEVPATMAASAPDQAAVKQDAFIPPLPADHTSADGAQDSRSHETKARGGAPATVEERGVKHGVAGLIARVTGGGRASRPTVVESIADRAPTQPRPLERPRRLGGVSAEERLPVSEPTEDLLDIPAFLRRQAN